MLLAGLGHYSLPMKSIWSLLLAASASSSWIDSPGTRDIPSVAETSLCPSNSRCRCCRCGP